MEPLNLTPEQYSPMPPVGFGWFGHDPRDWGDQSPDDWFHTNQERFLRDLEHLTPIPHKLNVGPAGEGIYFLFLAGALVYVGQSNQVVRRLNRHGYPTPCRIHEPWFDSYAAIWVPRLYLDSVESFYIHYFDPPRNAKLPPMYGPACDYLELIP